MNNAIMKSILCLSALLALALPAQAAGVGCASGETRADKFVCADAALAGLDNELAKAYQADINKADTEQKQRLAAEQNHWLKYTRNACTDEACFRHAFWSRLAELATFFRPHSPLYKKESDKAEGLRQIIATMPSYAFQPSDARFCSLMFEDLKQMKDVSFVEPVVQAQSYDDPALDPWKQRCNDRQPLSFSYECESGIHPRDTKDAGKVCSASYGLPPFKLYELPASHPAGEKRYIFYSDDAYGPMNANWAKPSMDAGFAGFHQIDFGRCGELVNNAYAKTSGGARHGDNYNSLIEYRKQYYFLTLDRRHTAAYYLTVAAVGKPFTCSWALAKIVHASLTGQ